MMIIKQRDVSLYSDQVSVKYRWLTTFNDLITLLMVFFVLLFSMGHMDVKRFTNFQNALQSAMGVLNAGRHSDEGLISDRQWSAVNDSAPLQEETMKALPKADGLEAVYTHKGIKLTLNDALLFRTGSARITEQGAQLLQRIGDVIKPLDRRIRVEGHTDDLPIATRRYPSNWELSAARAVEVVRFFAEQAGISPTLLSAAGYGSFKPKASNDTEANRAANRRVEIILGREDEKREAARMLRDTTD